MSGNSTNISISNVNFNKGFTLIELITTISIAMILAAIGVPGLQTTIQNNKMTALHNDLLSALNLTRSTAVTQGTWATFCKSNVAGTGCTTSADSWENGWILFPDNNNNGKLDEGESILGINTDLPSNITIKSSRERISYNAQGYAVGYTGNFTYCDARGDSSKKGMIMSNSGRIRVATSRDSLANCSSPD